TPKPDDRLAYVECSPLAEAVDATATVLTLTAQPEGLPPKRGRSRAFPGHHIRVGDELIRYAEAEIGPPFRFTGCQRGSLGTAADDHAAGAQVRGLLAQWGFFLVDPDSTLADEVTQNFADVINACDFDFVYFDASDGTNGAYLDGWYYQNKMHLDYYRKLKRDVLYQTSCGTGRNILWHMVPRSASADGHGDIKGYLDQRWAGILGMGHNWTKADVGWYYWFKDVRPDQIEYVCAKALGVDGTISLETSREAMDRLTQTRQMFEMIARYEECRRANVFGADIREKLREPKKDFRLFRDDTGWALSRAVYEEPRLVDQLDGEQNVWTITNTQQFPVQLGAEIVRGKRHVGTAEYNDTQTLTIEDFNTAVPYRMGEGNEFEKFVVGGQKVLTPEGPVRKGVSQAFEITTTNAKVGANCLVYTATNEGTNGGWSGIGRRFASPLNLTAYAGVGLWIHGDAQAESVRFQFRDVAGRHANWVQPITFSGWRLFTFPLPKNTGFDWSKTEYVVFCLNDLSAKTSVRVMFDDVRMLPELRQSGAFGNPAIGVNDNRTTFPVDLRGGQAMTVIGAEGAKLWPGGMRESQSLAVNIGALVLRPGPNTVIFGTNKPAQFPGDVSVLLYQMWPLEE
ncbi:MAG: hypothetical protein HN406_15745, partial [Lentisphaerae bacterium]|nr:hypothetical protein [Lentisphaerota bacterium]